MKISPKEKPAEMGLSEGFSGGGMNGPKTTEGKQTLFFIAVKTSMKSYRTKEQSALG